MPDTGAVVMGFDFGGRRIGVAVGQRITGTASALAVITNSPQGPDWSGFDKLLKEWKPAELVVGLPLTLTGEEQAASRAARAFAKTLGERYGLPVFEHDERYSSRAAEAAFALARSRGEAKKKQSALLDAQAARLIVESFLSKQEPAMTRTELDQGD